MPRLSFVIPTHNRREMLLAAVDSVRSQALDDWELIIVDDGSAEPVREYVDARDQRLTVHRNDSPLGAAASRNIGAGLAKSDFVAFLDDDDTLDQNYATRMLELFATYGEQVGFAWPTLRVIDKVKNKEYQAQERPCLISGAIGTEDSYVASAYTRTTGMMFRTAIFRAKGGFDEGLAVSEDREFVFRLLSDNVGCSSLQSELVNFYIHAGPRLSTDANLLRQADCDTRVLERHRVFILSHPKLASRYLNLVAKRQKMAGLRSAYESTLRLLLQVRPFDLRARRRLLLSTLLRR